jgi:Protein of unknown function (DUF3040)
MRRPRAVALSGAERRALRMIDKALTEEDPELSALVGELAEADRPGRRARRTTWIYVGVSVVVLVFGLVVDDRTAMNAGIVMLLFVPVVLLCAVEVGCRWP